MRVLVAVTALAVTGCAAHEHAACGVKIQIGSTVLSKSACRTHLVGRFHLQTAPTVRMVVTRRESCRAVERQTFSDGTTRHVLLDPLELDHELDGVVVGSDGSELQLVRSAAELNVAQIVGVRFTFNGEPVALDGHWFPEHWAEAAHACESLEGVLPGDATPEQVQKAANCLAAGWQLPGGWYTATADADESTPN